MLEAKIFYVGRGASVLLRLGEEGCGKYGIVDCFWGTKDSHPLFRELERCDDLQSIEFLVLTHPHKDHFLGVSKILETYPAEIKKLCYWGINPWPILAALYRTNSYSDRMAQKNLEALEDYCDKHGHKLVPLTGPGIPIYHDAGSNLTIESAAPPGNMLRKVEKYLIGYGRRCRQAVEKYDKTGELQWPVVNSKLDLNHLSSAIKVSYHDQEFLLGGDVLKANWNFLLKQKKLEADVIMLSHHGSYTGFPTKHWGKGFGRAQAVALISGEGKHQPSKSVVDTLRKAGNIFYCTAYNVAARKAASSLYRYVSTFHHKQPAPAPIYPKQNLIVNLSSQGIRVTTQPI